MRWRRASLPRLALAVAVLASAAGCSSDPIPVSLPVTATTTRPPALTPATPGRSTNSRDMLLESGGDQRRYRMHVPLAAPPGPRPLLVLLHAGGASPQSMEFTIGMDSVADRLGIYIAYPEALSGYWNNGRAASVRRSGGRDDSLLVRDVVKDIRRHASIDAERVFVGGHADGAVMAAVVAAKYPTAFTGLAMVSGQLLTTPTLHPSATTPLLLVHGTRDPLFPREGLTDPVTGSLLSVDGTLEVYRAALKVGGPGVRSQRPDRDPRDGTRVTRTTWGDQRSPRVTLYTLDGGGSPRPGGTVQPWSSVTRGRTSRDLDASSIIGHFVLDTRRAPTP